MRVWNILQSLVTSALQLHGFESSNNPKIHVFVVCGVQRGTMHGDSSWGSPFDEERDQSQLAIENFSKDEGTKGMCAKVLQVWLGCQRGANRPHKEVLVKFCRP